MQNKINILTKKIENEIKKITAKSEFIKGTICSVDRKRIVAQGKEIIYKGYQLTYKGKKNITKTIYMRKNQISKARKMISNYHAVRKILDNIVELNITLLKEKAIQKV